MDMHIAGIVVNIQVALTAQANASIEWKLALLFLYIKFGSLSLFILQQLCTKIAAHYSTRIIT
jgi:hypothetical protein